MSKDRIMIIVAFISVLFIGFIVLNNIPNKEVEYSVGSFYKSKDSTIYGTREGSSYLGLVSSSRNNCPGLDNTQPKGTRVSTSGTTAYANSFGIYYLPYVAEDLSLSYQSLSKSNLSTSGLQEDMTGYIQEFCPSATNTDQYEIIAPFAYTFEINNTDVNQPNTIVIRNSSNNMRMVCTNVANWFCAGTPGTYTVYSNTLPAIDWGLHNTKHLTIIGPTSTSKSGGSAGELIGYGTSETQITYQIYTTSGWVQKPFINLLVDKTN